MIDPMSAAPASDLGPLGPGLYIVATPIGNLGDITVRAAAVLAGAALIAAEDTRVTARLLAHLGIERPMIAYHDHNADSVRPKLLARMAEVPVALVSDAGTPLISDPGYKLVREARALAIPITTAPGPCAAVAALTVSGLPTARFLFAGFLPSKGKPRAETIQALRAVPATLVFYESAPRLAASLAALAEGLGAREAVVARELTKRFEEVIGGTLPELAERYASATPKGEIVIVVSPPGDAPAASADELDAALSSALAVQSLKRAVAEVSARLGAPRRAVYSRALALRSRGDGD